MPCAGKCLRGEDEDRKDEIRLLLAQAGDRAARGAPDRKQCGSASVAALRGAETDDLFHRLHRADAGHRPLTFPTMSFSTYAVPLIWLRSTASSGKPAYQVSRHGLDLSQGPQLGCPRSGARQVDPQEIGDRAVCREKRSCWP